MKGYIATIGLDGRVMVKEATKPTLDLLQAAIGGGSIERVPFFDTILIEGELKHCVAFCDEEGKGQGQHPNAVATLAWETALRLQGRPIGDDYLAGLVCVTWGDAAWMRAL